MEWKQEWLSFPSIHKEIYRFYPNCEKVFVFKVIDNVHFPLKVAQLFGVSYQVTSFSSTPAGSL